MNGEELVFVESQEGNMPLTSQLIDAVMIGIVTTLLTSFILRLYPRVEIQPGFNPPITFGLTQPR